MKDINYNHVTLAGKVGTTPEIKEIVRGKRRAGFCIAVERPYKDYKGKGVCDFFNVIAWGKLAEIVEDYITRGSQILIEGRLQSRSYEQDGKTKWITEIVGENISFIGERK